MPKFRKSKVTSEAKVAQKIVTYCLYIWEDKVQEIPTV
jgi:hypothetical protein